MNWWWWELYVAGPGVIEWITVEQTVIQIPLHLGIEDNALVPLTSRFALWPALANEMLEDMAQAEFLNVLVQFDSALEPPDPLWDAPGSHCPFSLGFRIHTCGAVLKLALSPQPSPPGPCLDQQTPADAQIYECKNKGSGYYAAFLWQKLTDKYLVLSKLRHSQLTLMIMGPLQVVVLLATLLPWDSTLCGCLGQGNECPRVDMLALFTFNMALRLRAFWEQPGYLFSLCPWNNRGDYTIV